MTTFFSDELIRILLVEDEGVFAMLLTEMLSEGPYEVTRKETLESSLACLREDQIDIVLLDLNLPDSLSEETFNRLHAAFPDIPIVILTQVENLEVALKIISSGGQDYLVKSRLQDYLVKDSFDKDLLDRVIRYALIRSRAEKELREARDELETRVEERTEALSRSNEELEQFAYVASHDLQEPLRMVTSYTELLAKKYEGQLDEKADKYIHYIVEGAKRMQGLISDLLSFSRIDTKARDPEPTDCSEVVDEVLNDLQIMIEESKVQIRCGDLPTVLADHRQIGQVFQNLIINAITFRGDEPPRIEIGAESSDSEWTFFVKDNGIGIAPEFFDRVFTIFQRLHERDKHPGSGIGLSISKKIVERHGGRIWIESEPDKGTTFFFTLPLMETREGHKNNKH